MVAPEHRRPVFRDGLERVRRNDVSRTSQSTAGARLGKFKGKQNTTATDVRGGYRGTNAEVIRITSFESNERFFSTIYVVKHLHTAVDE